MFAKDIGITNSREWKSYCRLSKTRDDIPSDLPKVYKNKGWKGWADFLGKEK